MQIVGMDTHKIIFFINLTTGYKMQIYDTNIKHNLQESNVMEIVKFIRVNSNIFP